MHRDDGYENFEEISMFVKKKMTQMDMEYVPYPYIHRRIVTLSLNEEKILKEETKVKIDKTKEINNYMSDLFFTANMLEWAGISFNSNEWFKLKIAIKKILIQNDCEYIRFFGKIFGINSDYYIIQGVPRKYKQKNGEKYLELRGSEGINKYTFWVSDSLLENWVELPDITHEQIITSRKFKLIFTGCLSAPVSSFVPFPGREAHLLRCQITRILHSSNLVPKGFLKIKEDMKEPLEGKVTEPDDEYKPASFEEMKSAEFENWVHEEAYIYPNGKIICPEEENQVERMKGIAEDEGYKVKEPPSEEGEEAQEIEKKFWKIKIHGDQILHVVPEKEPISHAVVHICNERWPGTHTVWKEGNFCNIYVGFGVKNQDVCFSPSSLEKLDKDTRDVTENAEPNPEKEPVIPEPDSDEEKKEEEEGENKE